MKGGLLINLGFLTPLHDMLLWCLLSIFEGFANFIYVVVTKKRFKQFSFFHNIKKL